MAYSPAKETNRSNEGNTSGSDDTIKTDGSASTPASEMNKKGKNDDKATKVFDPKTGKSKAKGGTYASAKKKDPKLDSYIKTRNNAKKSGDKSAYNAAQNKINIAYGKGPTDRKTTTEVEKMEPRKAKAINPKDVVIKKAPKITSSDTKKELDKGTFKEDKVATEANRGKVVAEKILAGDKKAGKKAGLKGGLKRQANRAGKAVGKKKSKDLALDKAGEATTRKEVKKSGVKGKFKRAAMDDVAAKKDQKNKKMQEIILSAATFKDFDQMDTKNAESVAEMKTPMEMSDGPIKYFKQSIKYDIREATNPNLTSSARKNYSMNAEADMKSPGKMTKAPMTMSKAPTEMQGAKRKGGSIISKHMKS